MYLKHVPTGELVEVIDLQDVVNPHSTTVLTRGYGGDHAHRAEKVPKEELMFPSGESLPECWTEKDYYARSLAS